MMVVIVYGKEGSVVDIVALWIEFVIVNGPHIICHNMKPCHGED